MARYIVVVINEPVKIETVYSGYQKIDFLAVGHQFHGRNFKGMRPDVFIDQTTEEVYETYDKEKVDKWIVMVRRSFGWNNVTVIGTGLLAGYFAVSGGERVYNSENPVEYRLKKELKK